MIKKIFNSIRDYYVFRFNNGIRLSRKSTVLGSSIDSFVHVGDYAFVYESTLSRYTSVGRGSIIRNAKLGSFCSISWGVTIGATPHNYKQLSTHAFHYIESFGFVDKDIRLKMLTSVGHDVWVGANAVVFPGVTIGDGAVIGAGAIVTKDVRPYEIVAGNPAKHLRWRFDDEVIDILNELKWWEWSQSKIANNIGLFNEELTVESINKIDD